MCRRRWQFSFSLGFVALFLFLFVMKPAPEQALRVSVAIDAPPEDVTSVLETGRSLSDLRSAALECPRAWPNRRWGAGRPSASAQRWFWPWQGLACLAQSTDDWVAVVLTKAEKLNVSLEPQASSVLLTAETRWQVRGGLLGKAVDRVVARRAREKALTAALLDLKAKAEEHRTKQA